MISTYGVKVGLNVGSSSCASPFHPSAFHAGLLEGMWVGLSVGFKVGLVLGLKVLYV